MNIVADSSESIVLIIRGSRDTGNPMIAFRGNKNNGRIGRKILKCPISTCKFPIANVDENAIVDVIRNPVQSKVNCQNFLKCKKCGNEVGVNYN